MRFETAIVFLLLGVIQYIHSNVELLYTGCWNVGRPDLFKPVMAGIIGALEVNLLR